jgi:hypothetical protein
MKLQHSNKQGSALVVALSAITVIAVLVGVTLTGTGQNGRLGTREKSFTSALNAADGALDYAYAKWKESIANNGMRPPANAAMVIPAPTSSLHPGFANAGVTFSGFSVVNTDQWGETTTSSTDTPPSTAIIAPVAVKMATVPGFPGFSGTAYFYRAQVSASVPSLGGPVNVTLRRNFQATGVSPFQAAIFFEHDIELHPGQPMTINGLVHTNNTLWAATGTASNLKFLANVSYAGDYKEIFNPYMETTPPPPQPPIWADGLTKATSATAGSQLHKTERMEPFGTDPAALFSTADSNPNNDGMREIIEPPVTGFTDPPEIAALRIYNQATVRIAIDRTKAVTDPNRIVIRNGSNTALPAASDTAIRNSLTVGTTGVFDYREGENVLLTNVDMKKLDTALVAMGAGFNGVLYIQDVTPTGKTAIRLQNGAVLNRDISVASNNAVYIQGDYNTGGVTAGVHDPNLVPSNNSGNPSGTDSSTAAGYTKRSTAVMADAVMILSNSWNDANAAAALTSRVASHTTVNTAILSGLVPTNYEGSGRYSGGPHNFPRFLETWSGKDFTYLGSMIQIFNSKYFDGIYNTGNIYSPPGRRWGFDTSFLDTPPPGTLQNPRYSRGRWDRL